MRKAPWSHTSSFPRTTVFINCRNVRLLWFLVPSPLKPDHSTQEHSYLVVDNRIRLDKIVRQTSRCQCNTQRTFGLRLPAVDGGHGDGVALLEGQVFDGVQGVR